MIGMKRSSWLIFSLLGLVLCGGLALQLVQLRDVKRGDTSNRVAGEKLLGEQMPRELGKWQGVDEPLGPNEVVQSSVEKILNYDDYVYRNYSQNGRSFSVYIAHWGPGRMPIQKVASHTPDRCWSENGWTCDDMRFNEDVTAGEIALKPAQWRIFRPPGSSEKQYVLYWHLVGEQLYDYGERFNRVPSASKWWRDTLKYAFSGSDAQYFIRVTSARPFEELVGDEGWESLLRVLSELGLKRA
jgi:hypothetical protein